MEEFCPYLKEHRVGNLGMVIYCAMDNIPLYRKCCPPRNQERFYICYADFMSCKKIQNSENKPGELEEKIS